MNRVRVWLLLAVAALVALPALAASPVWKVSKDGAHFFVGGTIHLLSEADYPLPPGFDQAYRQADTVVLEMDAEVLQSAEFQRAVVAGSTYKDGRTLEQLLKPKTYRALQQHLSSRGIPAAGMMNLKPGLLSTTLTVLELERLGLAGIGVDQHFSRRAGGDRKKRLYLETAQQQLAYLTEMGVGREDQLIAYTLRDMEQLPVLMRDMKAAWRQGDNDGLRKLALKPLRRDFPRAYRSLIAERNRAWMPRIEAMLATPEIELILVGALHLVGRDGVLARLAAKGCVVEQL